MEGVVERYTVDDHVGLRDYPRQKVFMMHLNVTMAFDMAYWSSVNTCIRINEHTDLITWKG